MQMLSVSTPDSAPDAKLMRELDLESSPPPDPLRSSGGFGTMPLRREVSGALRGPAREDRRLPAPYTSPRVPAANPVPSVSRRVRDEIRVCFFLRFIQNPVAAVAPGRRSSPLARAREEGGTGILRTGMWGMRVPGLKA